MVPTVWLAKVKLAGDKVSEAVAPVPVRLTVWALLLAPSVIDKAPVSVPVAEGVNVTEMAHVAPETKDEPQLLLWEKLPLVVMPLMLRLVVPVLAKVTV